MNVRYYDLAQQLIGIYSKSIVSLNTHTFMIILQKICYSFKPKLLHISSKRCKKLLSVSILTTTTILNKNITYCMKSWPQGSERVSVTGIEITNCVRLHIAFMSCSVFSPLFVIFAKTTNQHALCRMDLLQPRKNTSHFFDSARYRI